VAHSKTVWVTLGKETAKSHPLYGFGGWAWLVLIYLLAQLGTAGWEVSGILSGSEFYSIFGKFLIFSVFFCLLALCGLLIAMHRFFRPLFCGYVLLTVFVLLVPIAVERGPKITAMPGFPFFAMAMIALVIYVKDSRRLNVTMLCRVLANDPILPPPAEGKGMA
jgi:hypothetical protein